MIESEFTDRSDAARFDDIDAVTGAESAHAAADDEGDDEGSVAATSPVPGPPRPAPAVAGVSGPAVAGAPEATVAAALADIDARVGRPPAEQVAAFAEAHQVLQATLALIDVG